MFVKPLNKPLIPISIFVLLALFFYQIRTSDSLISIFDPWFKMPGLKAGDSFPEGVKFT